MQLPAPEAAGRGGVSSSQGTGGASRSGGDQQLGFLSCVQMFVPRGLVKTSSEERAEQH